MNHYAVQWIEDWCQENGWTDLFKECSLYWAFPPNAVMPVPIPAKVLRSIKAEHGLSPDERLWSAAAVISAIAACTATYFFGSPLPIVASFAFCAIVVARMEDEMPDALPHC